METDLITGPGERQPFPRYYGDERRVSRAGYLGAERRVLEPSTEQDHPEEFEPQAGEAC